MNDKNVWGWVVGIIIVLLVAAGVWWYMTMPAATTTPTDTATTTPQETNTTPAGQSVVVESQGSATVAQVVASLSGTDTAAGLFTSTGVSGSLTGKGPYTVFVPTDVGIGYLPKGTITGMTAAQKLRLMQYHVVKGKMLDIDAIDSGSITALSGDMLNFQVNSDSKLVQVNSAYALRAIRASNGIVYVINGVLLPPQKTQ